MDMHERSEQLQRVAAMAEPKLADITARIYNGTAESIFNALVAMTQETLDEPEPDCADEIGADEVEE